MRNFLQIFLWLAALLVLPATLRAQSVYDGFGYTAAGGAVTITSYAGPGGAVVMPVTINGLPVTAIGTNAFYGNTNLTSLVIGADVTSIGSSGFAVSKILTSVTLPDSLVSIGASAFANCPVLTYLAIPTGVTNIGNDAFYNCGLGSVTLPNGILDLGQSTFGGSGSLTNVTIPASVTEIGISAFAGCPRLTGVYFQGNAPGSSFLVFSGSGLVTNYYLPGTSGWGATFDGAPAVMLNPPNPAGSLQVTISPAGAVAAGAEWQVDGGVLQPTGATVAGLSTGSHTLSFTTASGWTAPATQTISVSANSAATTSGTYVAVAAPLFTCTTNNGTITITGYTGPGGALTIPSIFNGLPVAGIGGNAFQNSSLTSVTIASGITVIGADAFWSCLDLTNVTIPNSVTNIGVEAFASCAALTGVTLGTNAAIPNFAFEYCTSLGTINIPLGVPSIGSGSFAYCPLLTSITLPNSLTSIGGQAFERDSGLTSVTIPASLTGISNAVFAYCAGLSSVSIPNSVTNIGGSAFLSCGSLASITLPDRVVSIGDLAFSGASLVSVTIPASVTGIGEAPFGGSSSLTAITVAAGNPDYVSMAGVLFNKGGTALIEYPAGGGNAYTIPNSVTSIGAGAFAEAAFTNITIPGSVTNLGSQAFASCPGLERVSFLGNAPAADSTVFSGDGNATAYYYFGFSGWGSTIGGIPVVLANPPTGSLQVTITPSGAITAGAEWQVDGGSYQASGAVVGNLLAGSHTVSFNTISGWTSPASQTVVVLTNSTVTATGTYVALPGALQVNISPAAVVSAGAQWKTNGGTYQNSGVVLTGLAASTVTVSFNSVAGWTAPATQTVAIVNGQTTVCAATYQDATKPVLSIVSPKSGLIVTNNTAMTISGTASDNWQVINVFYSLNQGAWSNAFTANNWTNWTAPVTLAPGTNTIAAYAVDPAGDVSPTATATVVCVVNALLTVRTNQPGWGQISPNDNGLSLPIGNFFSLTATASAGFQFASWTNNFGMVSNSPTLKFAMQSNLVLTASFVDTQKPALSITAPTAGQRVTNPMLTLTGVASDNVAVAGVSVQLNNGALTKASGTTSWSATVTLVPGTNSISAYATDSSGNLSATNSVVVDLVVTNLLGVQTVGLGTVSPNDSNVWLEVGRNYTMTANPATGFVFTNWTVATNWQGGALTNQPTVLFMMASNLTLTANFVETSKPVVTITNLTANKRVNGGTITVAGTASDNWQVSGVWCQANASGWLAATTTNGYKNWTAVNLGLTAGTNIIKVYASDLGGNYSTTNSVTIIATNVPAIPIMVATNARMTAAGLTFNLQITGSASGLIQASTNLTSWTTITNFAGTNTTLNFRDPMATNGGRRYYRAVVP